MYELKYARIVEHIIKITKKLIAYSPLWAYTIYYFWTNIEVCYCVNMTYRGVLLSTHMNYLYWNVLYPIYFLFYNILLIMYYYIESEFCPQNMFKNV